MSITRNGSSGTRLRALSALVLALFCTIESQGQNGLSAPKVEVKVGAGVSTFNVGLDDNLRHTVVNGAVRIYLYRRLSIEPEVMYMRRGAHDRDIVFTPQVAFDLTDPRGRLVPYVIAGIGVEHHEDQITFRDFFNNNQLVTRQISGNTWSANIGGGVKIFLTDRLFAVPDARVGHEPSYRATVSIGYVFAGRKR